jgi:hypothetical protein
MVREEDFRQARERMVHEQLGRRDIVDGHVLDVMRSVPRHLFVPPDMARVAYSDAPLPIGFRQTISQPYIVALMAIARLAGIGRPVGPAPAIRRRSWQVWREGSTRWSEFRSWPKRPGAC